jgi:hypothetical protein
VTVGFELARARRRLRISRKLLSKRTNLSVACLTAIEKGDLDRLPDMIHLRNCVGTFAQEVGLDPDSVSARYMAQLPGRSPLDEFESEESSSSDSIDFATKTEAGQSRLRLMAAGPPMSWGHTGYAALVALTLITLSIRFWTSPVRQKQAGKSNAAVAEPAGSPPDDLGGSWMLTSRVEHSSLRSYDDLTLGFRLQLAQQGNRVRGQGLKWIENGRPIASRARTPITVEGTIDDGRLVLAFTERGIRRTSHGTLHMRVADDGTLQGRFSTDAARSSGRAQAVRLVSQPD